MTSKTSMILALASSFALAACSDGAVSARPDAAPAPSDVDDASSTPDAADVNNVVDTPPAPDVADAADATDAPPALDVAEVADVPTAPDAADAAEVAVDTGPACAAGSIVCEGACVNTSTDPGHCGACDVRCPAGNACDAGRCALACPAGQSVCGDACATLASDPANCGACGTRCASGASCVAGACQCPTGQVLCEGACVDLATSRAHCGACGRACAVAGGTAACVEGTCRVALCTAGLGDCDGDAANGCETNTAATVAHCGACGRACAPANATPACAGGACAVGACAAGFANCDMSAANGCEVALATDARNCGACGTVCATGTCAGGACLPPASCAAALMLDPAAASGRFMIDPDGTGPGAPFEVYCDMATDGGGWTYLATLTNLGDAPNAGNWLVANPTPNNWESTTASFGALDPSANADYRSPAFHSVPGRAVMITHRNLFLLRTDEACVPNATLRDHFNRLGWECAGSQDLSASPACSHACTIVRSTALGGDTALLNGAMRARLFLKCGEADGAQDTNRDRAYFSTNYRTTVDAPVGLGAFCSGAACSPRTGEADVNDYSDAITPSPGTEFYGVWIR